MRALIIASTLVFAGSTWAAFTPEQAAQLPPPAEAPVDFQKDIKPVLDASCIKCHGRGKSKGGFAIDNRETFLKGGDSGPAVIPGKSGESLLVEMVSGIDPDIVMPQKGSKLTTAQVSAFRRWIDDGAPWDDSVTFGKLPPKNLHPRTPEVPKVEGVNGEVDSFVWAGFKQNNITPKGVVEDRVFARRVFLDCIGLLPTPAELEKFCADQSPDKRQRLVKELLGRDLDYAQHWMTFWNDALRNDYRGTGYIDGGRKQITTWLFSALVKNKPYNEFVAELINPTPESEGFSRGIVWRGVVNASQTPQMQAAQNISQVFMGVNLKCASCHDSFINDWTLADAYGLASVYSDEPLEMFKCDVPVGKKASVQFIYPELGQIEGASPKPERMAKLAEVMTSDRNGRLTRTIVNRLWARFMGRGLIEPVDEMDNPAWNQDLLDWLASDFAAHNYDLKHAMEVILTSRAYQLPTVPVPEQSNGDFVFNGPLVRRLTAEQFVDALAQVTGVQPRSPAAKINFARAEGRELKSDFSDHPVQPKWIWNSAKAASKAEPGTVYFRKYIELGEEPAEASFLVACDNSFVVYVNGRQAGAGKDYGKPAQIDASPYLRNGINLIAVMARNFPGSPSNQEADQANPAGLWIYGRVRGPEKKGEKPMIYDFATDSTWLCAQNQDEGWQDPVFPAANWNSASDLGDANLEPWKMGTKLAEAYNQAEMAKSARAVLANNDALLTALGRPNREQVVTSRPSAATTLQALELTNGSTLAGQFKTAGANLARRESDPKKLASAIYFKSLGRDPLPGELRTAAELLGSPAAPEAVEDLLWAVAMLPEFQLIY